MTKLKGKRLRLSAEEVEMINESRGTDLENINGNTALEVYCDGWRKSPREL